MDIEEDEEEVYQTNNGEDEVKHTMDLQEKNGPWRYLRPAGVLEAVPNRATTCTAACLPRRRGWSVTESRPDPRPGWHRNRGRSSIVLEDGSDRLVDAKAVAAQFNLD